MYAILQLSDFEAITALILILLVIIAGMFGVLARGSGVNLKSRELVRLARLEAKVDLLLQQAGLTYDGAAEVLKDAAVRDAMQRGDKIHAILLYRQATGAGLADAKAAIEQAMAASAGR